MSWKIAKSFNFSYTHRVWKQELDFNLSDGGKNTCRFIHGHNAVVKVYLESEDLNTQGMIIDFRNLQWFKKFLDNVVDHKFIFDLNDPLFKYEYPELASVDESKRFLYKEERFYLPNSKIYENFESCLREKYEGTIFVDFIPTSERLAEWLFNLVNRKMMKLGVFVHKLEFWETPKSVSIYYRK